MLLRRARTAILPAAALAGWGTAVWAGTLRPPDIDRDDVLPVGLAVALTIWALLDYYFARFRRESRKAEFDQTVSVLAEGVSAEMRGHIGGDGQHAPGPRKGR